MSRSLKTVDRELARYNFDAVGIQEVTWDRRCSIRSADFNFYLCQRKRKSSTGNRGFVHHRI